MLNFNEIKNEIKELNEQLDFFKRKNQRLEKENKELKEQVQALGKKLVNISEAKGFIKFKIDKENK